MLYTYNVITIITPPASVSGASSSLNRSFWRKRLCEKYTKNCDSLSPSELQAKIGFVGKLERQMDKDIIVILEEKRHHFSVSIENCRQQWSYLLMVTDVQPSTPGQKKFSKYEIKKQVGIMFECLRIWRKSRWLYLIKEKNQYK